MSDILFIKTSSLGDVIHHMPALTEARRRLPGARFAWVVEEAFAPLVGLHPAVSEVIPVASRRWRGALHSPSTCLLFKSALIARLARGRRHGYDADSIRERAASSLYDVQHAVGRDLHAIARNRMLTALALGYQPDGAPEFGLERNKLARTATRPYGILLHATARPEKEWPQRLWIALGRALRHRTTLLLPWGNEAERARSTRIAAALDDAPVPERQPLDAMARLIAGASFVVGVDTGLLHLAAALGVPLVAIFVGSEPGLTGPMGRGPIAVLGGKDQMPSVDEVAGALERLR
jgi:heptosyltransferase-1